MPYGAWKIQRLWADIIPLFLMQSTWVLTLETYESYMTKKMDCDLVFDESKKKRKKRRSNHYHSIKKYLGESYMSWTFVGFLLEGKEKGIAKLVKFGANVKPHLSLSLTTFHTQKIRTSSVV